MSILVSIIIPTYKRPQSLLRLLGSLKQEINDSVEVIIVEQGENNGKAFRDFATKNNINLKYFFNRKLGTSYSKNIGVKKSKGKFLIFFDDDVVIRQGLIEKHLADYEDNSIGAVGGRVLTVGQTLESNRDNSGRITFLGKFTDGFSSSIKQEIETVIGCNCSWRRDVFEKIGGFDENFYGAIREDSDLSLRTRKQGYKIVFEPKAVVEHLREPTGGARKTEGRMEWYFNFFSNETYFFLKHRPKIIVPIILLTRWEWALRCMFGFGREVSFRSMVTPFLGIIDGIRKYRVKRGRQEVKNENWS